MYGPYIKTDTRVPPDRAYVFRLGELPAEVSMGRLEKLGWDDSIKVHPSNRALAARTVRGGGPRFTIEAAQDLAAEFKWLLSQLCRRNAFKS